MSADGDKAWYVYCVVPAEAKNTPSPLAGEGRGEGMGEGVGTYRRHSRAPSPPPPPARGGGVFPPSDAILPSASIEAVDFGPLTILASLVPRALFDQASAVNRTADPDWMAARVQAHHAVNVAATQAGPCLPLTFGALFSTLDRLQDWLTPRQGTLCNALAQVGALTEWTLALHEEPVAHAAWLDSHDPALRKLVDEAARAGEGTAFLIARRLEKARTTARSQHLADQAARVSATLAEAGCTVLPEPPRQGLPNWTVLARDDGLPALAASLGAELPLGCVSLRLTGPWPAYGFARAALSGEVLHA